MYGLTLRPVSLGQLEEVVTNKVLFVLMDLIRLHCIVLLNVAVCCVHSSMMWLCLVLLNFTNLQYQQLERGLASLALP